MIKPIKHPVADHNNGEYCWPNACERSAKCARHHDHWTFCSGILYSMMANPYVCIANGFSAFIPLEEW